MMARVQVALSFEEHRRARARAADLGVSFAEYVRRLVAQDLGELRPTGALEGVFDLGDSAGSESRSTRIATWATPSLLRRDAVRDTSMFSAPADRGDRSNDRSAAEPVR